LVARQTSLEEGIVVFEDLESPWCDIRIDRQIIDREGQRGRERRRRWEEHVNVNICCVIIKYDDTAMNGVI